MTSESPIRVLIVDDSVLYRAYLSEQLQAIPGVEVVGRASNGDLALKRIYSLKPDLITLDLEMPIMNGLETLAVLRQKHPAIDVVMISGVSQHAADVTLKAMSMGALDFVTKPQGQNEDKGEMQRALKAIVASVRERLHRHRAKPPKPVAKPKPQLQFKPRSKISIVAIGVSTGGPKALNRLLAQLDPKLPVPVVIVQHMPALFTASLAMTLNEHCPLPVREAIDGEAIKASNIYLAPGGRHMKVVKRGMEAVIELNDGPPEQHCRPSVNVLFRSIATAFGKSALGIILTGMGADGAMGVKRMKRESATIIAQDEASCVVYGMPKAAFDTGAVDIVASLEEIAPLINAQARGRR